MFDLWGQTVPVPMPDLNWKTVEVTAKEKAQWEKELLGVSLSKQVFGAIKTDPGTTLCGDVDAGMDGQSVVTIGEVAVVSQLFTRERKPFVKVMLEDISGSIEVMVWPRVYESTVELWQEGNVLRVEGKVRLDDDRVRLNCSRVDFYQTKEASIESAVVLEHVKVTPPVEATQVAPLKKHRLVISITQTSDPDSDITRLRRVIDVLKEFPGEDEVTLRISSEDNVDTLRFPNLTTGYCPELNNRLVELVGEAGLRVENLLL
jgi:DNA polymerase-3 subunit alpha